MDVNEEVPYITATFQVQRGKITALPELMLRTRSYILTLGRSVVLLNLGPPNLSICLDLRNTILARARSCAAPLFLLNGSFAKYGKLTIPELGLNQFLPRPGLWDQRLERRKHWI